ncbi:P-loop containing nucleoside triphosphate hydrolase protein [Microthyrium microscopicum]|uniref:P-loop containing nucleoside triphosphate hydrolase protein n=1 Tax=Microthyrium microscopicum TaxID=703497 RepID=A0A6A6UT63_9PEZI|nr:P-loop containing nucleoside triphosphate hydrolase protein [Microthyrium microscopicum]
MTTPNLEPSALTTILPTILPLLHSHRTNSPTPFILAISGAQGSGKSTLASALATSLRAHNYSVLPLSLDDLYLPHSGLVRARESGNALLRTRGAPGTHDEVLGAEVFGKLRKGEDVKVPQFDKSRFSGEGDRVSEEEWEVVGRVDVVVFEGWCVGFRALSAEAVEEKWMAAKEEAKRKGCVERTNALAGYELADVQAINVNLARYEAAFMGPQCVDYMVHLDTENLETVFGWRTEQEHVLKKLKGEGMGDEQVERFVMGYMPSYQLYLDELRTKPFFKDDPEYKQGRKGQLLVVLDKNRQVVRTKDWSL